MRRIISMFVGLEPEIYNSMTSYALPVQWITVHSVYLNHYSTGNTKPHSKIYIIYMQYTYTLMHLYICIQGCKESVRQNVAPKAM